MKMKFLAVALLLLGAALPTFGQQISATDEEIMKTRQALTDKFAAAVAKKDVATAVAELYTADAILQSLCPESPLAFGREAYAGRLEGAIKSGFRDYAGKVKEAPYSAMAGRGRRACTRSLSTTRTASPNRHAATGSTC